MYKDHSIAVVVPCYNEETQITAVVETMPDFVDHIIIVDDKSPDTTVSVVKQLMPGNPRIVLLEHTTNQGVGGAIATGYKWARDNDSDIAVVMAGDGQMDPDDLPGLLDPIVEDKADYTKGNRLITRDAYELIPKVRFFGNAALSLLTKIASGYWGIADSQSGYTAINKDALNTIDWDDMYKRYGQPNDLLVRLNIYNFRVQDVEIKPVYNVGEKSGIRVRKVVFSIGWLLVRLFFWRLKEKYIIRDFHPLVLFYALGIVLFGLNILFFVRLVAVWLWYGSMPEITLLIWIFTFSNGLLSSFMAMWLDMQNCKDLYVGVKLRRLQSKQFKGND